MAESMYVWAWLSGEMSPVLAGAIHEQGGDTSFADVEIVGAHTLAQLGGSTAVVVRCQFANVATVADSDGNVEDDVWRWGRHLR
jgi:hypothetical protein